jgi:hypothetical protein
MQAESSQEKQPQEQDYLPCNPDVAGGSGEGLTGYGSRGFLPEELQASAGARADGLRAFEWCELDAEVAHGGTTSTRCGAQCEVCDGELPLLLFLSSSK